MATLKGKDETRIQGDNAFDLFLLVDWLSKDLVFLYHSDDG